MATEKSIYDTLRNNKYRSNLPDIFKTQYFYRQTERSKLFEFKNSIFENIADKFDMDKLEEEQASIINKIEEFKSDTIQLYIQDNKIVNKNETDKITSIPNELQIKLREYFGNKYFKIGMPTQNTLYHSVLTLVDPHFYFKTLDEKEVIVRELKNALKIEISENNLHKIFNFGKKRWSVESLFEELNENYKCSKKTIGLLAHYFNKNIILFNSKDKLFEKTDNISYNKPFLILISNLSILDMNNNSENHKYHLEPIMTEEKKELLWENEEDRKFLSSIDFVYEEINIKNIISDETNSQEKKKYSKSELNKLGVDNIRNIANILNLELTTVINNKLKNITKTELIKKILEIQ